MAKIQKFVKQVDYLWYESEITDEQLVEWKKYQNDEIDEPEWVHELDFDLVKDSYIENALKGAIISSLDSIKEDSLEKLSAIIRKYLLS